MGFFSIQLPQRHRMLEANHLLAQANRGEHSTIMAMARKMVDSQSEADAAVLGARLLAEARKRGMNRPSDVVLAASMVEAAQLASSKTLSAEQINRLRLTANRLHMVDRDLAAHAGGPSNAPGIPTAKATVDAGGAIKNDHASTSEPLLAGGEITPHSRKTPNEPSTVLPHNKISQDMLALSELSLNEFIKIFNAEDVMMSPGNALKRLNNSTPFKWELLKSSEYGSDAVIFTSEYSGNKICIKAHPNGYPAARKNYSNINLRSYLNEIPNVVSIIDARTVRDGTEYMVVAYPYINGKNSYEFELKTRENYYGQLLKVFEKYDVRPVFNHSDIIVTPDGIPIVTDWNKFQFTTTAP